MDKIPKETRSAIMRAVKSRNNKSTELALIKLFRNYKITGWKRNQNILGKPDFYFSKLKLAIFADGCFWHGCSCKRQQPLNNKLYWKTKISKNIKRDKSVNRKLRQKGYMVIRIKECSIKRRILPKKLCDIFNIPL